MNEGSWMLYAMISSPIMALKQTLFYLISSLESSTQAWDTTTMVHGTFFQHVQALFSQDLTLWRGMNRQEGSEIKGFVQLSRFVPFTNWQPGTNGNRGSYGLCVHLASFRVVSFGLFETRGAVRLRRKEGCRRGEWRGGEWRGGEWRGGEWRGGEYRGRSGVEWSGKKMDEGLHGPISWQAGIMHHCQSLFT